MMTKFIAWWLMTKFIVWWKYLWWDIWMMRHMINDQDLLYVDDKIFDGWMIKIFHKIYCEMKERWKMKDERWKKDERKMKDERWMIKIYCMLMMLQELIPSQLIYDKKDERWMIENIW